MTRGIYFSIWAYVINKKNLKFLIFHIKINLQKAETHEDPANRYFNAFPALSDQLNNTYCHKTTSWPQVDTNKNSQSEQPKESINNSTAESGAIAIIKKKPKRRRVTTNSMMSTNSSLTNQMDVRSSNPPTNQPKNCNTSMARSARNNNNNNVNCKANQKKKSLEIWDTDFDGAWEMGRDLIREFVLKQNNRNRSISESDAARFTAQENEHDAVIENAIGTDTDTIALTDQMAVAAVKRYEQLDDDEENLMRIAAAATSALFGKTFDMNMMMMYPLGLTDTETVSCSSQFTDSSLFMPNNNDKMLVRSEGYATPDTLGSWSEADTATLRRERDHEPMNCMEIAKGCTIDIGSDCVDSGCDENNYLAAFEAKFNHNVEALWNDCKPNEQQSFGTMKDDTQLNHSFWPTYQTNNNNNSNAIGQMVARPPQKMSTEQFRQFFQENNQLQPCSTNNNSLGGMDRSLFTATQPNSLNSNSSSTGGMNLTTSIWTDNPNNNEDDISFYANARLWEMNQSKTLGQNPNVGFFFIISNPQSFNIIYSQKIINFNLISFPP